MNMGKMMKQARQMQEKMDKALANVEVEGSSGGGMVKVTMNGSKAITNMEIDPEIVDPEDVEMLQDMIMAAINDATRKADEEINSKMGGMLPPGMQGMF